MLFNPFNNFTCIASSLKLGNKPRQMVQTNWPSSGRQDIMKSCCRESFKTCTISSSLISIPSNNNKWKVQTYFYVTISILVNSCVLGMLFDTFPINARTQNPRQCETKGKTAISYHRHIPNVCQAYPHKSQDVQTLALNWPDYYLPGHVWKCRRNLIKSLGLGRPKHVVLVNFIKGTL